MIQKRLLNLFILLFPLKVLHLMCNELLEMSKDYANTLLCQFNVWAKYIFFYKKKWTRSAGQNYINDMPSESQLETYFTYLILFAFCHFLVCVCLKKHNLLMHRHSLRISFPNTSSYVSLETIILDLSLILEFWRQLIIKIRSKNWKQRMSKVLQCVT